MRPILGQSPSPMKTKNSPMRPMAQSVPTSPSNECAYCKSNGYDSTGHNKLKCPRLASLSPCAFCGACGINNHTASHCPRKPRTVLRLKQSSASSSS